MKTTMITVHAPITVHTYDADALAREFRDLHAKFDALSAKFNELRQDQATIDRLTSELESQQAALGTVVNANTPKE